MPWSDLERKRAKSRRESEDCEDVFFVDRRDAVNGVQDRAMRYWFARATVECTNLFPYSSRSCHFVARKVLLCKVYWYASCMEALLCLDIF